MDEFFALEVLKLASCTSPEPRVVAQISLPRKLGGIQVGATLRTSRAAYIGSVIDCNKVILGMEGSSLFSEEVAG